MSAKRNAIMCRPPALLAYATLALTLPRARNYASLPFLGGCVPFTTCGCHTVLFAARLTTCLVLLLSVLLPSSLAAPRKIIIDTDPGTDDALAILLALNSPELDVKAITVVPGNVTARQGLENALKLVSLAGRCDIPVAGGAQHPLNQKLITAEFWHGRNGLGNVELPESNCRADTR